MRGLLLILLMVAMPFQASLATAVAAKTAATNCSDADGRQPCCPVGEPCDCGCPAVVAQPVRAEEPERSTFFSGIRNEPEPDRAREPGTRRDRPPSPPPRGGR